MPVSKKKKTESINLDEKYKELEQNVESLYKKVEALYDGLSEMRKNLKRVMERMGL